MRPRACSTTSSPPAGLHRLPPPVRGPHLGGTGQRLRSRGIARRARRVCAQSDNCRCLRRRHYTAQLRRREALRARLRREISTPRRGASASRTACRRGRCASSRRHTRHRDIRRNHSRRRSTDSPPRDRVRCRLRQPDPSRGPIRHGPNRRPPPPARLRAGGTRGSDGDDRHQRNHDLPEHVSAPMKAFALGPLSREVGTYLWNCGGGLWEVRGTNVHAAAHRV